MNKTFIGIVVAIINLNNKNNHHFQTLTKNNG
ncbi:putative holin-like toxin [Staphylococcus aureus]|nr:putative holin-like toxin [Staphylococcus aureus]